MSFILGDNRGGGQPRKCGICHQTGTFKLFSENFIKLSTNTYQVMKHIYLYYRTYKEKLPTKTRLRKYSFISDLLKTHNFFFM